MKSRTADYNRRSRHQNWSCGSGNRNGSRYEWAQFFFPEVNLVVAKSSRADDGRVIAAGY